jgi:hypothetical protein
MTEVHQIDFPKDDSWFTGPLPENPAVPSGWRGLEKIMPSLIKLFCRNDRVTALEFGVEYGYSTAILAQLFGHVLGVDTFVGDDHSSHKEDHHEITLKNLAPWRNITLAQRDYRHFIKETESWPEGAHFSLIHVDMMHDFETTYTAGRWAADHAPVVIFHDTNYLWPEVKQAIIQIAEETGKDVYEYKECFGLGILI